MNRFRIGKKFFIWHQKIRSPSSSLSAFIRQTSALASRHLARPTPRSSEQVSHNLFCSFAPMQGGQRPSLTVGAPEFANIKASLTCDEFQGEIWGFTVYRCAKSNDETWNRMLQHIRDAIEQDLNDFRDDSLRIRHDLQVVDDEADATSHQVREHFRAWASNNIAARLDPDAGVTLEDIAWKPAVSNARYHFCIFIDSICLESLDHLAGTGGLNLNLPVVKLLDKEWPEPGLSPEERRELAKQADVSDFQVPEDFDDEQDVGWMYMPLHQYVAWYDALCRPYSWQEIYARPPYIMGGENEEDALPGYWRRLKIDT